MDVTSEGVSVERVMTIAARPETVWQLLTDDTQAIAWMGRSASFDLRIGGTYRVEVLPGNVARGEFVEIDVPRRLVFTWGWEPGSRSPVEPGSSTVEFELTPHPDGTLLRFRHSYLPDDSAASAHADGWDHYLGRLSIAASGGSPGVDPWVERPGT